ncbi:MAG: TIGR00725 family protein [Actinomycetota bacterium]
MAVIGAGDAGPDLMRLAEEVGELVAGAGAVLVSGGLGGVMEASCRGAVTNGGLTVGFLPGLSRHEANPHVSIAFPTGMGEGRNHLVVRASDGLIAVGGGFGTLSEIALSLKLGKPLVGLETWRASIGDTDADFPRAASAREAVEILLQLLAIA